MNLPITLDLPLPPSVNKAYAIVNGRQVHSRDGREYAARVSAMLAGLVTKPIDFEIQVSAVWFESRQWIADVDNRSKALLDALSKSGVWTDDQLVARLTVERRVSKIKASERFARVTIARMHQ